MRLFLLAFLAASAMPAAAGDLPAFPGAEGFGSTTPGGRGGKVIFVTNLNDAGIGSLRAACEAKGPRIVVFRVAGIIDLKSPITIREPKITVAGQSAPGDGVCLRRHELVIETSDVVVRYFRSRPGDLAEKPKDGLMVGDGGRNVIIDHCSVSWATDENLSPSGAISDVTVQWCIISEGLNRSVHNKGAHGYGSLARASGGISLHHNLWAHNNGRNPRIGDNYGKPPFPTYDIRNNVMYNYVGLSLIGDTLKANYVGNYWRPGPNSRPTSRLDPTDKAELAFHLDGNVAEGRCENGCGGGELFSRLEKDGRKLVTLLEKPLEVPSVRTVPARQAYAMVLESAGASRPARDAVDRRIIEEVRSRSGAIIDSQWEVGGWPEYRMARPPRDSDGDGMPDEWETAHKLNPKDRSDAAADRDGDGYTSVEEYLNQLAAPRPARPAAAKK